MLWCYAARRSVSVSSHARIPSPRPLPAAHGPRHRAGMVTAKRHTKTFIERNDLPQACYLPAPAGVLRLVPAVFS